MHTNHTDSYPQKKIVKKKQTRIQAQANGLGLSLTNLNAFIAPFTICMRFSFVLIRQKFVDAVVIIIVIMSNIRFFSRAAEI